MLLLLLACNADYKGPVSAKGLWAGASAPNRAHILVELVDARGRGVAWSGDELTTTIDGSEVLPRYRGFEELDGTQSVVLLVDLALEDSGDLAEIQSFATKIAENLDEHQTFTMIGFDEDVEVLRPETTDTDKMRDAIDALTAASGPTNRNAALVDAFAEVEDQLLTGEPLERSVIVLLSDGGDPVDDTSLESVQAARGELAVMAVGVGTDHEDVATHGSWKAKDIADLPEIANEVLERLLDTRDALVLATWCSDVDDGSHVLGLDFERDRLKGSWQDSVELISTVATWGDTSSLPVYLQTHHARVWEGAIYVGGGDEDGSTYWAPILDDGRVGRWREGPQLDSGEETRFHAGRDRLYAINGENAWTALLTDGEPQGWTMTDSPGYANVIRHREDVLYSITRQRVYFTELDQDNLPEGWQQSSDFPEDLDGGYVGAAFAADELVVVGSWRSGSDSDWITRGYRAPVESRGSLGNWTQIDFGTFMGLWLNVESDGDYVYVFPGADADGLGVLSAAPGEAFAEVASLAKAREWYSVATSDEGFVYLHGGRADSDATQEGLYSQLSEGDLALDCVP
ncbi:MAG TPA: vWA domain-containing protein [Myxococcota bacterium]|nr:vWA domain-containing protein [Myxococcota bacterium]